MSTQYRPILFSGPMVRAILEGWKTQTRRVVKTPPNTESIRGNFRDSKLWVCERPPDGLCTDISCPFGAPGDRLWVRETFAPCIGGAAGPKNPTLYRADALPEHENLRWKPSIFMPRWASRLTLEVTGVRVERVQEISAEDARAEGVESNESAYFDYVHNRFWFTHPTTSFKSLWDSINGDRPGCGWEQNPWCWCLSFRIVETENA